MSDNLIYSVAESWSANAWIDADKYQEMYQQSINNPNAFWSEQAHLFLSWQQDWTTLKKLILKSAQASWFIDGKLNIAVNCIDRHLEKNAEQTAIIWEGDEPDLDKKITYLELHEQVSRLVMCFASAGLKKEIEYASICL